MDDVICPDCGAKMVLRETKKFLYPNSGNPRKFYGCSRWPSCNATHGAHPDGRPLGRPGDAETKALRSQCHALINEACTETPKSTLYSELEELLGLGRGEVHFGNMNKEDCQKVIEYINEKWRVIQ
jgi:ssDNA-binding Zn-finger/Zn-ribbon topoisomerase 1